MRFRGTHTFLFSSLPTLPTPSTPLLSLPTPPPPFLRELALQTFQCARDLMRFTSLRCALLVGGDSMDLQFEELSRCPDTLVATPGRLMHHLQVRGRAGAGVEWWGGARTSCR